MGKKIIGNVRYGHTWTSYIASVEGVLRSVGWWDDETYKLMGMTGMAFHFFMHRTACPSSVTVYDWRDEHLAMMDRLGIHSDVYLGSTSMNTFKLLQQAALQRIKDSLERGLAVVVWAPSPVLEFGILSGYDDEDGVLTVQHGLPQPADPLLYSNLGKSEVPLLFYQIFHGKVQVEPTKTYRDSLHYALGQWNKEVSCNPSGRRAYDSLLGTLDRNDFDIFGLAYNLAVYADAKQSAARYLAFLSGEPGFSGLQEAADLYGSIANKFGDMAAMVPFFGAGKLQREQIATASLGDLARACRDLEGQAMQVIECFLNQ